MSEFISGIFIGIGLGSLYWSWLASKEHIHFMAMLNEHIEWLQRLKDQQPDDDWWKKDD